MKFPVKDIPDRETIHRHIFNRTDFEARCRDVSSKFSSQPKIELELPGVDVERLRQCVLEIVKDYGFTGWQHEGGTDPTYGGFSLTYNPDHQDGIDPHHSTIGTPKNQRSEFFWNKTDKHENLKHSYFDTYGFRKRTPASKVGYLGEFIDTFKCTLIRSRVGIIVGENVNPDDQNYAKNKGWHKDEPVFWNLRVNIPLQTDEHFLFEMEGAPPYHLDVGKAYTWDTYKPHRVFARGRTETMRIHLVLGFSPWLDYDPDVDAWSTNEHFGKLHPFDMIAQGILCPHLKVLNPPL